MAMAHESDREILVIDDDEDTLASISELLDANGYHAHRALTGDAALQLLAKGCKPVVVLLDWWLPEAPAGVPLVTALRERLGDKLAIVVISGDPRALAEARRAAVNDYLPKPFVVADLLDVVDNLCP